MTKFRVEIRFGAGWVNIEDFGRYKDALDYIRVNSGEKYPMRVVRIDKTVVFEEKKN